MGKDFIKAVLQVDFLLWGGSELEGFEVLVIIPDLLANRLQSLAMDLAEENEFMDRALRMNPAQGMQQA